MRYLSVCSGIEAATVAWHPLGWTPVAFSEIEPFPSAVLKHHYPTVPNWGDMTKYQEWPDEPIDLLVGGTPCQSFSVAGLRKGLGDPRGNLMLTYGAIAKRYRPRWLVWENVPGVLSSNDGRDFGTFLGMLAELGYGFAYRVLDAQFTRTQRFPRAVPQRRGRVFVVGHLGNWQPAAAVLFERESLSGHPAPSRTPGKGIAASVANSIGSRGTLKARTEGDGFEGCVAQPIAFHHNAQACQLPTESRDTSISDLLTTSQGAAVALAFKVRGGVEVDSAGKAAGKGYLGSEETAFTLAATQDQWLAAPVPVGTDCYNGSITGDVAATMGTTGSGVNGCGPTVMQPVGSFKPGQSAAARSIGYEAELAPSLEGGGGGNNKPAIHVAMQVRRLTPVECERLQGFPDGWTNIPWRGKPESPDGPRYKALGNSMAVNCMDWIGRRIAMVDAL